MNGRTKMIVGLVGAAAAGVMIGLILAPAKGTDTRLRIKETAGGWTNQLGDIFSSAKEGISNLRNKSARMASDAANRYSDVKESYT